MHRLLTTLLATLAIPFLAMGTPLCCVVGAGCCHVAPQAEKPDDRCPCCPGEPEPNDSSPTPECDCSESAADLSRAETALVPAPVLAVAVVIVAEARPPVLASLAEAATVPPSASRSAFTLPLLL